MKKPLSSLLLVTIILVSSIFVGGVFAAPNEKIPVIVGFKELPDAALVHAHGGEMKYEYSSINAIAATMPIQQIEALKKNPKVAYVEEDVVVQATEYNSAYDWGISKIGANLVHPTNKGPGIKVAVIDTGINYLHEDLILNLANREWGYNYINPGSLPIDDNGHGTHCAGIIAAALDDDGVVGVAPEAQLYALKVLNSAGSGYTSDIIKAIEWAVENEIQVISMSLGASVGTQALQDACNLAFNNNIVVVAAAGNNGAARTGTNILYPARYTNVIAVGATDPNNVRAYFSNTGPELDLMAPGVNILSDYIDVDPEDGLPNHDSQFMSGTSMATPHVAGTAALILSSTNEAAWKPYGYTDGINGWSSQEVTNVLIGTADDLGTTGKDNLYGYGIVDADQAALTPPPPPVIIEKTYSPTTTTITKGTNSAGSVDSLFARDDVDLSVKSAKVSTSQTIDWYSTTTISEAPSTVNSLTITYEGSYNTPSKSQTLYLFNFATNKWQSINVQKVDTTDVPITYVTNTPANFISPTGDIQLRTYATQRTSTSFTCNADYTQISIIYAQ